MHECLDERIDDHEPADEEEQVHAHKPGLRNELQRGQRRRQPRDLPNVVPQHQQHRDPPQPIKHRQPSLSHYLSLRPCHPKPLTASHPEPVEGPRAPRGAPSHIGHPEPVEGPRAPRGPPSHIGHPEPVEGPRAPRGPPSHIGHPEPVEGPRAPRGPPSHIGHPEPVEGPRTARSRPPTSVILSLSKNPEHREGPPSHIGHPEPVEGPRAPRGAPSHIGHPEPVEGPRGRLRRNRTEGRSTLYHPFDTKPSFVLAS